MKETGERGHKFNGRDMTQAPMTNMNNRQAVREKSVREKSGKGGKNNEWSIRCVLMGRHSKIESK